MNDFSDVGGRKGSEHRQKIVKFRGLKNAKKESSVRMT